MHKISLIIVSFTLFAACQRYPKDVERALKLAGDNRPELEKVLEHYRTQPEDSLKYRAACFLIGNMPGKYSEDLQKVEQYDLLLNQWNRISDNSDDPYRQFDSLMMSRTLPSSKRLIYDVLCIDAEYLTDNIDKAFKVWEEQPWGKDISFNDFCETILPYRISSEPLERWRDKVLENYRAVYDSLKGSIGMNTLDACQYVYSNVDREWRTFVPQILHPLPSMNYSRLEAARTGTCIEQAAFGAFIMRALGIPVSIDYTPQWPDRNHRHLWNSLLVPGKEKQTPFMLTDQMPGIPYLAGRKMAKVYRQTWRQLKNIMDLKDVSSEYFDGARISLRMAQISGQAKTASLAVFSNPGWIPVSYGMVKNSRAHFNHIGKEIVYLLFANYREPVGYPFWISQDGETHFLEPDTLKKVQLTLYRKYPLLLSCAGRMNGGIFEGSNDRNFKAPVVLHRIDTVPGLTFQTVLLDHPGLYRYLRYLAPANSYGNVAELEFYHCGQQMTGKPMGVPDTCIGPTSFDKVFDGDVLTFFDTARPNDNWVGMDFGRPVAIDKIRYLPRNDDNNIAVGQTYELFYWDEKGWVSLGRQNPAGQVLHYDNAPANALFWLRNLTKGVEERIFTYENGKQVWW